MSRAEEPRVRVLDDASSVGRALSPVRRRILEHLAEPDSAAGLAARLRLPRQKVNYHLRVLEKAGYSFEGCLRKSVTKDGQTIDQMIYATIRE